MGKFNEWLYKVWKLMKPWMQRNVTFGLVLAICTEAPRWVFAFICAHEPVWAGVAVAVLLAFAAAQGWDEYFRQRDPLLLCMNIAQVGSAMIIITPVIYSMTIGDHTIELKHILPIVMLWIWSATLVVTTFLPLIVVAYVEVQRHNRQDTQCIVAPTQQATQPIVIADQPIVLTENNNVQDTPNPIVLARQLRDEGLTVAQISVRLDKHKNTITNWLKKDIPV